MVCVRNSLYVGGLFAGLGSVVLDVYDYPPTDEGSTCLSLACTSGLFRLCCQFAASVLAM